MAERDKIDSLFKELESELNKDPSLAKEIDNISSVLEKMENGGEIRKLRHPYVDAKPISETTWLET